MRVLITGAAGQLGRALLGTVPARVVPLAADRGTLDITDAAMTARMLRALKPDAVINAAAYTGVDAAETERAAAFAVNAAGAENLARAAADCDVRVIHLSTDFVFDGAAARPYLPADKPAPLSVYGASKLEGEQRVLAVAGCRPLVLRTSWLYAMEGRNFATTMLRLMATSSRVRVVADQVGTPTWAPDLAHAIWHALAVDLSGIHHWSDAGVASWYDFAVALAVEAGRAGLLPRAVSIEPINTEDFPTPARRPPYSVLDKSATWTALGLQARHWQEGVRTVVQQLAVKECVSSS